MTASQSSPQGRAGHHTEAWFDDSSMTPSPAPCNAGAQPRILFQVDLVTHQSGIYWLRTAWHVWGYCNEFNNCPYKLRHSGGVWKTINTESYVRWYKFVKNGKHRTRWWKLCQKGHKGRPQDIVWAETGMARRRKWIRVGGDVWWLREMPAQWGCLAC